jgi:hypothetical protein
MSATRSRLRTVAALTLMGTPSYVFCCLRHVCIGGHMQHGPYPLRDWISDFWWIACFVSVLVLSVRIRARGRLLFLVGSLLLIISRLFLGDNSLIELPLLGAMIIYALGYLVRPSKFKLTGEQSAASNGGPATPVGNSGVAEGPPSVS